MGYVSIRMCTGSPCVVLYTEPHPRGTALVYGCFWKCMKMGVLYLILIVWLELAYRKLGHILP